jgi:hypothetical protein
MAKLLRFSLLIIVGMAVQVYGQSSGGEKGGANAPAKTVDLGQRDGANYSNNFFGLSLSLPQTWVDVSSEQRDTLAAQIKQVLTTSDPAKRAQIEDSMGRSTLLLSLTKLPAGQPGNATFMLIAERIPLPSIKTPLDVIQTMKNAMAGTNFNVQFLGEPHAEKLGGADFASITVRNDSPYGLFMQKIYVTTKERYSLQLFYTYQDESDLAALDTIIRSIRIK